MKDLNKLTSAGRSGTLTVAGTATERRSNGWDDGVTSVTVSGTGLASGAADLYADGSWARSGATPADGQNTYTASAEDTQQNTSQDSVTVNLPASASFSYDGNGNLLSDGQRYFEYDWENQLTNVYVSGQWRSEFVYDGLMRRRVRKEYTWSSGAWVKTNEVRYVYDGRLVLQERDSSNVPLVSYTRGKDLSGELEEAGGIGGLLARTDVSVASGQRSTADAYYHCDGHGNVTCLIDYNNLMAARYSYDPYGSILSMSGPLASVNLYRFSSKEYHANSGTAYYLYRFYDPNLQRWLNRDPLEEYGGLNLYAYLLGDPMNGCDPYGLGFYDWLARQDWIDEVSNWGAGLGDNLSFNGTKYLREHVFDDFYHGTVNPCSTAYRVGEYSGIAVSVATGVGAESLAAGGFRNIARYELGQKCLPQLASRAGRLDKWVARPVLERGDIVLRAAKGNYVKAYLPKASEIMKPFTRNAMRTLPTPLAGGVFYGGAQGAKMALEPRCQ